MAIRSITSISSGDLIDRAVRYYRARFWTLVLIAAPPVIVGTLVTVGWTVLGRQLFAVSADRFSVENTFYLLFAWLGSVMIWLIEMIATLVVMGGASRNFVRHMLFGEAITFRETYQNVWHRLGGLIVASTSITFVVGMMGFAVFYATMFVAGIGILLIAGLMASIPVLAVAGSIVWGTVAVLAGLWVFFLGASRLAYVPQVMLVEGQGVFAAIARSASLASGNVRRLGALFIFTTVAAYSALALFYVPLAWYASANGVPVMSFDADLIPAWYEVAYNLIWQLSFILLSPVWMIGLCLLYVDERVRREGYDIELMAAARLGDIPSVPSQYVNPLQPALGTAQAGTTSPSGITTLGLK
jgi:hypothetical protein